MKEVALRLLGLPFVARADVGAGSGAAALQAAPVSVLYALFLVFFSCVRVFRMQSCVPKDPFPIQQSWAKRRSVLLHVVVAAVVSIQSNMPPFLSDLIFTTKTLSFGIMSEPWQKNLTG